MTRISTFLPAIRRVHAGAWSIVLLGMLATRSHAQVMLQDAERPAVDAAGQPDQLAGLRGFSLLLVEPPKPREIRVHDKVTIIVSESSKQSASQSLDTKQDATYKAALKRFPDLAKFLDFNLANGAANPIVELDASGNAKFKGEGKYDRDDRFTDRITATIIDIKPNGVLVVEAKRTIQKDEEIQTLVLSGECRREDVTRQNTILSNQLANMTLATKNEGRVKESANKGVIPRLLEAIFNW
jgi:flagellar L-ring protein precursor FlgH